MRHEPGVGLVRRHIGRYAGGMPSFAHRGVLRANPDLFANLQFSEIDMLVGQNDNRPFPKKYDDLLPDLDSRTRTSFKLAVIGLTLPDVRVARVDTHAKPPPGILVIQHHFACERIPLGSQARIDKPVADKIAAEGRPCLIDHASAAARGAMATPNALWFIKLDDLLQLAAQ